MGIGLSRRSMPGLLLAAAGGAYAFNAARASDGIADRGHRFARSAVTVSRSPEEVFRFWRKFENLPRFMRHLHSVKQLDNDRWQWTAYGPGGSLVEWTAETVAERENEIIAWRSVEGSAVQVDGSIEFRIATGGRGTVIDAAIQYRAPGGALGNNLARLFGKDPNFLMEQDLRRFKALLETGEIPTTEGQAHGPRGIGAAAGRMLDPDMPLRGKWSTSESAMANRRVS